MAPTINCPSAPIFQILARKPTESPKAITARVTVLLMISVAL